MQVQSNSVYIPAGPLQPQTATEISDSSASAVHGSLQTGEQLQLQANAKGPLSDQLLELNQPPAEALQSAETSKKPAKVNPKPAPKAKGPLKAKQPEAKLPPKPEPPPLDPDRGIEKPPLLNGSKRSPEKADQEVYQTYLSLQREVRDDLEKAQQTPDLSQHKSLILEKMLLRLGREAYQKLPDEQKAALVSFLNQFAFKDLVLAEVQSEGGAEAVDGIVTGTGVDGHYTGSMLRSLQGLLEAGRLSPELLQGFEQLNAAPLHSELEPQRLTLMRSALQELAFPERIEQHSKGTCAPTTIQILLSLKNPVQYLRILQGLSSPDGKVPEAVLNGASGMEREADTLRDDRSGRSLSSRLLQPAFMEYANAEQNYDNARDRNSDGQNEYAGLPEHSAIYLSDALFGKGTYQFRYVNASPDPSWQGYVPAGILLGELKQALGQGEPVPVGLRWGESGHKILLTALDQADQKAYFMNPWGELQNMPLETFSKRLDSASLPKKAPAGRQAINTLFGSAASKESYQPIRNWRYYKISDYLLEEPSLQKLPEAHKEMLREKFRSLRLSPEDAARQMDVLLSLSKADLANEALFQRIEAVGDKDQLAALVQLYAHHEKLPAERFKQLIAAEPDKNLDSVYYEMLMEQLADPAKAEPLLKLAQERQAMKLDGRDESFERTQARLKEEFIALESGGSLETLKTLASSASEQTRLLMLHKVREKWPAAQAEAAATILLEGLNTLQLNYVLRALEPQTRYLGADTDEQLRRVLRSNIRNAAIKRSLGS